MPDIRIYAHPADAEAVRIDKALAQSFGAEISRTRLEESFRAGAVKINGAPVPKRRKILPGERAEIEMPPPIPTEVAPADIPVEVVFEDEHIVAVNKPAGMTVHPGSGTGEDTLVHAMMHRCGGKLSMAGGAMRPGIVHRLDKETSGIMLMAKTDEAYYRLVEMFSRRELEKEYAAIICGVPTVRSGIIDKPIGRHPTFRTKMCVSDAGGARPARTEWFVAEKFGCAAALVSCKILTGRTHQIRVHMSSIGFPILGDYTYGFQKNKLKLVQPPERVMLHSSRLALEHPVRPDIALDLRADPPRDFQDALETLRKTYS